MKKLLSVIMASLMIATIMSAATINMVVADNFYV